MRQEQLNKGEIVLVLETYSTFLGILKSCTLEENPHPPLTKAVYF